MELNEFKELNRRAFLTKMAGASPLILFSSKYYGENVGHDQKVARIVSNATAIDTHNHIDVRIYPEQALPNYQFQEDFKKSGFAAIVMTFAVDYQKLQIEGDGYNRFIAGIEAADSLLKDKGVSKSLNVSDLKANFKRKKPTVIQSVEGGHFLEGKIERLQLAYDKGLRVLGLLHDNDALVSLGDIYTKEPVFGGLSEFGKAVVKECCRLGILIDLTHCSNQAINDAIKLADKPMMVSHTSLSSQLGKNEKMNEIMKPRLISHAQAKIVANAGGLIGVWRHLTETSAEYVKNIKAMVDVVGIDHVCIGTDTKLTRALKPNDTSLPRPGELSNEIWQNQKSGFVFELVSELLKAGFTEKEIIKISSSNFIRIFDKATK